jgi:hypothetical protein
MGHKHRFPLPLLFLFFRPGSVQVLVFLSAFPTPLLLRIDLRVRHRVMEVVGGYMGCRVS